MPTSTADRAVVFATGVFIGLAVGIPVGAAIVTPRAPETTPVTSPAAVDTGPPFDMATYTALITGHPAPRVTVTVPADWTELLLPSAAR